VLEDLADDGLPPHFGRECISTKIWPLPTHFRKSLSKFVLNVCFLHINTELSRTFGIHLKYWPLEPNQSSQRIKGDKANHEMTVVVMVVMMVMMVRSYSRWLPTRSSDVTPFFLLFFACLCSFCFFFFFLFEL
jgi:hypothetical protein